MTRPATKLRRRQDWPERLAAFMESRRHEPFAWGKQDCALLAADAVLEITGADPATRRDYSTEDEADKIIAEAGSLEALADAALVAIGAAPVAPAYAQRGDVVLLSVGNQPTLGIVLGRTVAAPGADGMGFVPLSLATKAWAI